MICVFKKKVAAVPYQCAQRFQDGVLKDGTSKEVQVFACTLESSELNALAHSAFKDDTLSFEKIRSGLQTSNMKNYQRKK